MVPMSIPNDVNMIEITYFNTEVHPMKTLINKILEHTTGVVGKQPPAITLRSFSACKA